MVRGCQTHYWHPVIALSPGTGAGKLRTSVEAQGVKRTTVAAQRYRAPTSACLSLHVYKICTDQSVNHGQPCHDVANVAAEHDIMPMSAEGSSTACTCQPTCPSPCMKHAQNSLPATMPTCLNLPAWYSPNAVFGGRMSREYLLSGCVPKRLLPPALFLSLDFSLRLG